MIVYLNGEFVPEERATISIFDRSFQYGDGLFETLRISNGKPFCWTQHLERLERGARFLQIPLPLGPEQLEEALTELVRLNQTLEAVLRITLSRGTGPRGYSPAGADNPIIAMSLHPMNPPPMEPEQWKCFTSTLRLAESDPFARLKTSNKLLQIMARVEAEQNGCNEALLLNTRGEVCETSSGNVFWVEGTRLFTPPPEAGLLPGVTRAIILDLAPTLGLAAGERSATLDTLRQADGVFITLSSRGVVEMIELDGHPLGRSPLSGTIYSHYLKLLKRETC